MEPSGGFVDALVDGVSVIFFDFSNCALRSDTVDSLHGVDVDELSSKGKDMQRRAYEHSQFPLPSLGSFNELNLVCMTIAKVLHGAVQVLTSILRLVSLLL